MIQIQTIDTIDKKQVRQFVQFHFDLYKGDPNWVPPFRTDIGMMLNKKKHPFYEHSDAQFFIARKDGKIAGRIAALNNRSYNQYHQSSVANFFLFDCIHDQDVADALFESAAKWAKDQGLNELVGPKGFSFLDGYGVLVAGFEERQMINMSAYNYPYYQELFEAGGFTKCNEFLSNKFRTADFILPEKAHRVADSVIQQGTLSIFSYSSKSALLKDAQSIARLYSESFKNNWEYFPPTDREIEFLIENVIKMIDPRLVKFIKNSNSEIVGFLITFPDISAAMQRHNGYLTPFLIIDIMLEMKRTHRAALNGIGIRQEYHGRGGTALLYTSMQKVFKEYSQFEIAEGVQMAESAKEIQREMETLGLKAVKRHRIYLKKL